MARPKKGGVNVSAAIKEFLKANKNVGPTEAAAAISKQVGKKVTANYVSNIKGLMNGGPKKKGRKPKKVVETETSGCFRELHFTANAKADFSLSSY